MRKRKGNKGLAVVVGVGALLALGGLASASQGGGDGPGGPGGDDGPGGGGGGGGGTDPWQPGPGGKGKVYGNGGGSGGEMPWGDFDFSGNGLWISPECDGVVEGALFRPKDDAFSINALEPTEHDDYVHGRELEAVLTVDPENSVAGFIDWWMGGRCMPSHDNPDGNCRGPDLPETPSTFAAWVESHWKSRLLPRPLKPTIRMTAELIRQVSPTCMEGNPVEWGDGLKAWLEDFMLWCDLYLHEWWSDEISFDPGV